MPKKFVHKPGFGTIFRSDSDNPRAPVLKGTITAPDNSQWDVALWVADDEEGNPKRDKNGKKFFSVKVSEPWVPDEEKKSSAPEKADDDEDVPF